jgi:preprotein translocase subunit SecF
MTGIGVSGRIARAFIESKLTPLLAVAALILGVLAVVATPREEEPQIVVPMIDVVVGWPGAEADEVERLVTVPLERAVREIPGVEYVYATSQPSGALVIVRFLVNWDPERALINVRDKVDGVASGLPPGVRRPEITPRSIDDVPILALTFSSSAHDPLTLRRMAAEIEERVRQVPNVATTTLIGGLGRELRVELDPERLAASGVPPAQVLAALRRDDVSLPAGSVGVGNAETLIEAGDLLRSIEEVGAIVLAAPDGKPVHLRDVAALVDGAEEPRSYVFHAERGHGVEPAVTLAVAKTKGANATVVADAVLARIERDKHELLPEGVRINVTRDYGETAREKSNELILHLIVATISVVFLMALVLGVRDSLVVGVAVPVTLALTLLIYYLWGYTLNRVTLFALIFSIGILVDDAIVVVENIHRHLKMRKLPPLQAAVFAVDEVGNPTILATSTDPRRRIVRHAHLAARGVHRLTVDRLPFVLPGCREGKRRRRRGRGRNVDRPGLPLGHAAVHRKTAVSLGHARHRRGLAAGIAGADPVQSRDDEDASVRQQERAAGHHRLTGGNAAGNDAGGGEGDRRAACRRARGQQRADLRRNLGALQLQRLGAALLHAPGPERRRSTGQPAAQERTGSDESRGRPRPAADRPGGRPESRLPHQGRRDPSRSSGAVDPGRRGLRSGPRDAAAHRRRSAGDLREHRRRG